MREIMPPPLILDFYERDSFTTLSYPFVSPFSFLLKFSLLPARHTKENKSYTHITTLLSYS